MRTLTIADRHSKNIPTKKIELPMEGGDPWYQYVWLNDEIYLVTHNDATDSLEIERVNRRVGCEIAPATGASCAP